ncbi:MULTISPECIES: flavin reductase family protein [unclassified Arcicella]|uniref:flavin reductase family protein n=1 Tax=unclassified Arcicella TaxID=2644986 RepID=UPI002866A41A|nr:MULTISPECIES: flavin reductase family protein [unclassified Arcicella]MDR6561301.1 flavin reductase (DIM6/NTAB) family NADH-FMN oxidoreductase RutF [Arcicella sp. BE51]MDR6811185.1 flavin reductase (DIM6/NTAB) family NADH-FMN oxidoreductase RutF [Arcicella sp. BE140]MDR6822535.1 flavin reductase (DIM6/NTAB) family NADH-FMN oxidoreductase RutF [Arcicella sp. BE139]
MGKSLLKYKNYDVHVITTVSALGKINANIATWVMQSAMQGKFITVALYKTDYTIELVRESMILNVNLLAKDQAKKLITKLGRKSGRTSNKFVNLPFEIDERGCPYLTEAIGYVQCRCVGSIDSGDHELFVCEVLTQKVLNPDKEVLTNNYLRAEGLVRG